MAFEFRPSVPSTESGSENKAEQQKIEPLLKQIEESELTPEGKAALVWVLEIGENGPMPGILDHYIRNQQRDSIVLFEDTDQDGHRRATLVDTNTGEGMWALINVGPENLEDGTIDYAINESIPVDGSRPIYEHFRYTRNEIDEVLKAYGKLSASGIAALEARQQNPPQNGSLHTNYEHDQFPDGANDKIS